MDRLLVKREPLSEGEDEKPRVPSSKQAASPAQEATRAHILELENQLRRLGRMRHAGRLDGKGTFQMRCVEEELRKAHSKLKRLLNEAERQRRRRERLRSGPRSTPYLVPPPLPPSPLRNDGIMAALKSCTRFQDFVRELNVMGFSITQQDPPMTTDEVMPEVDGVKVQIEMIEGDEELSTDFKGDSTSQDSIPSGRIHMEDEEEEREKEESYRQWFEHQTEMQQRWEEGMMREQMELARNMLEAVTATFLQGVQQVVESVVTAGEMRRRRTNFCHPPRPPSH